MERCGVCSDEVVLSVCGGEEGAELKTKALDLLVDLTCLHELQVTMERTRSWIQAVRVSFLHRGRCLGEGEELGAEPLLLHIERTCRRDDVSPLAWEHLRILLEELEEVTGTREVGPSERVFQILTSWTPDSRRRDLCLWQ